MDQLLFDLIASKISSLEICISTGTHKRQESLSFSKQRHKTNMY